MFLCVLKIGSNWKSGRMSAVLADVNTQETLHWVLAIEMFDLLSSVCSKLRLGAIFHEPGRAWPDTWA